MKTPSLVANLRDVVLIATIYLGFTGFVFKYAFNEYFGLTTSFDASAVANLTVYAYDVLMYALPSVALALGFVGACVAIVLALPSLRSEAPKIVDRIKSWSPRPATRTVLAFFSACVAFLILGTLASGAGRSLAVERCRGAQAHRVFVTLKPNADVPPSIRQYLIGSVVLLGNHDDQYAFLMQFPASPDGSLPPGTLYLIDKADVAAMAVRVDNF